MRKIFHYTLLITLCTLLLTGCGQAKEESKPTPQAEVAETQAAPAQNVKGDLKISMLNVGQGDAILIQTKNQNVLIDTSDTDERELLVSELEKLSVTKIDKLILSHPHADHIGSAKALINPSAKELKANPYLEKISVSEVYDNGIAASSPLYKSYMKAVDAKGITHHSLSVGDTLDFGGGVKFTVLYPTPELVNAVNNGGWKSDPNNESIVGKLTYKNFSMMFTGDAEKQVESEILSNNKTEDLKCDVLKSGHHGSYTASTKIPASSSSARVPTRSDATPTVIRTLSRSKIIWRRALIKKTFSARVGTVRLQSQATAKISPLPPKIIPIG